MVNTQGPFVNYVTHRQARCKAFLTPRQGKLQQKEMPALFSPFTKSSASIFKNKKLVVEAECSQGGLIQGFPGQDPVRFKACKSFYSPKDSCCQKKRTLGISVITLSFYHFVLPALPSSKVSQETFTFTEFKNEKIISQFVRIIKWCD